MFFSRRKWLVIVFALLTGVALVFAGCGAEEPDSKDPAALQQEIFKYAMSGAYYPFSYFDEDNNLVGFDVEIGAALAEAMGMEADPVPTPWQALKMGLDAGRYDAIIGSMTITEERQQEMDFAGPYYVSGPKLFVRADSDIRSVDDLTQDTTIAILMESVYEDLAREYTDNLKFYESDVTALKDLNLGRADAVITDQMVGLINAERKGLDIQAVGDLLMVEEIGIAVRKGDTELVEKLNQALAQIKADGTYLQIAEKYVGVDISGD
jgi:polar amino acid transport system substrate-binding protein